MGRVGAGQVPDLCHGENAVLGKAQANPKEAADADNEPNGAVAVQGLDIVAEVGANDRELAQRRVEHVCA